MKRTKIMITLAILLSVFVWAPAASADHHGKIAGKFFLQVEANGELWYIMPDTGERFLIRNSTQAMNLIKLTGVGISNMHLSHIPAADGSTSGPYDMHLTRGLAGKFLLQVEGNGEAWYVNPMDMKRYYLGRPDDAFKLFSSIATGISNETAVTIPEANSIVDVAVGAGTFDTLVAAVTAAGLAETLDQGGPFTVFAPTDEAFAKLGDDTINTLLADPSALANILLYHVVSGKKMAADVVSSTFLPVLEGGALAVETANGVMVGGAKVTATDIKAVNGVIHVIDTVLLPEGKGPGSTGKNIAETAIGAGTFSTLLTAVEAAGLTKTFSSGGPFTLFAPNDEAFAKLPSGTVEGLLVNPKLLTEVLLLHVVPGKVMASDVVKLSEAKTLLGKTVNIDAGNGVKVGGANVIATDIMASNGVIHVIDNVLLP